MSNGIFRCPFYCLANLFELKLKLSGFRFFSKAMSEEDYDKIFTKFSRIDNPLTRKVQGSGLGLYIAKSLVEKMQGEISVKSKDNETTFTVKFPSANIERQAQNAVSYTDN